MGVWFGQWVNASKIITAKGIGCLIVVKHSQTVVKLHMQVKHLDLWQIIDQGRP